MRKSMSIAAAASPEDTAPVAARIVEATGTSADTDIAVRPPGTFRAVVDIPLDTADTAVAGAGMAVVAADNTEVVDKMAEVAAGSCQRSSLRPIPRGLVGRAPPEWPRCQPPLRTRSSYAGCGNGKKLIFMRGDACLIIIV